MDDNITYTQRKSKSWTPEEDYILLQKSKENNYKNWRHIASFLPGKTGVQCSSRYKRIRPGLNMGAWTKDEDKELLKLYKKFGNSWSDISKVMLRRTGKQIRDRFLNSLQKNLNKKKFSQKEDTIIVYYYLKLGNKWTQISNFLKGRTGDMIKNRFHSFLKKNIDLYVDRKTNTLYNNKHSFNKNSHLKRKIKRQIKKRRKINKIIKNFKYSKNSNSETNETYTIKDDNYINRNTNNLFNNYNNSNIIEDKQKQTKIEIKEHYNNIELYEEQCNINESSNLESDETNFNNKYDEHLSKPLINQNCEDIVMDDYYSIKPLYVDDIYKYSEPHHQVNNNLIEDYYYKDNNIQDYSNNLIDFPISFVNNINKVNDLNYQWNDNDSFIEDSHTLNNICYDNYIRNIHKDNYELYLYNQRENPFKYKKQSINQNSDFKDNTKDQLMNILEYTQKITNQNVNDLINIP